MPSARESPTLNALNLSATRALLLFALSGLVTFVICYVVRRAAIERGAVVVPRPDRWHTQPTPTFGGIGILAGVAVGLALAGARGDVAPLVLTAAAALFVIGWWDDVAPLSALAKMVNALAVAAFFVFALSYFSDARPAAAVPTVIAIVWFGFIVNAVNLLDNMDGLAGGVSAIAALGLLAVFGRDLGLAMAGVLVLLAGALIGFLGWNRHPARLFMGNCGSLAVGGILAGASIVAFNRDPSVRNALAAALVLAVPIFDTGFVVVLRRLAGRSTTRGFVDHTSHRLVSAGFSEPRAVWSLYALGLAGAALAVATRATTAITSWPLVVLFSVAVLMLGIYLARVPAYDGQDFKALQNTALAPILTDLTFRWHAFEVLLDIVLITTCYYAAYRLRFDGDALTVFLSSFAVSLPIVLGCKLAALYVSGLYSRMWSTFGIHDLSTVVRGVGLGSILTVLSLAYLYKTQFERFSRGVFVIDAALLTIAIVGTRLSYRMLGRAASRSPRQRRVLIYGAGARGQLLARELVSNPSWGRNPVAFVDDAATKWAHRFVGVPVRGGSEQMAAIVDRYGIEEVLLSSPSINGSLEDRVRAVCEARRVPVRRFHIDIR